MSAALPAGLVPRGLKEDHAAEYVGLSPTTFLRAVAAGVFPPAISLQSAGIDRKFWDRAALDQALDRMSGLAQPSEDHDASNIRRAIDARKNKVRHPAAK